MLNFTIPLAAMYARGEETAGTKNGTYLLPKNG